MLLLAGNHRKHSWTGIGLSHSVPAAVGHLRLLCQLAGVADDAGTCPGWTTGWLAG